MSMTLIVLGAMAGSFVMIASLIYVSEKIITSLAARKYGNKKIDDSEIESKVFLIVGAFVFFILPAILADLTH